MRFFGNPNVQLDATFNVEVRSQGCACDLLVQDARGTSS